MASRGWPAVLGHADVAVRPLRRRDAAAWVEVRRRNEAWLAPWEGTAESSPDLPWADRHTRAAFAAARRSLAREAGAGRALPFAITVRGELAGQVTVANVVRGAFDSASVGYWVDERHAGRGVVPTALALVVDHCFTAVGLHRVEAEVRPENAASLRVVRKLGFREEGLHRRLLFIDGGWRDHLCFSLLREECREGVLRRFLDAGAAGPDLGGGESHQSHQ